MLSQFLVLHFLGCLTLSIKPKFNLSTLIKTLVISAGNFLCTVLIVLLVRCLNRVNCMSCTSSRVYLFLHWCHQISTKSTQHLCIGHLDFSVIFPSLRPKKIHDIEGIQWQHFISTLTLGANQRTEAGPSWREIQMTLPMKPGSKMEVEPKFWNVDK